MSLRVCIEDGCPELTHTTRCPAHTRAKDRARGTRQQRGYGALHQAVRRWWQPKVTAGQVTCWRCGGQLAPNNWTLGHCDDDRSRYHGPECPPCDYATAGRGRCPHSSHN